LDQARKVIESLRLAELDNFFRRALINAKPVNIDKVDPTAAVIYPVVLSDRLEVIVSLPSLSHGPERIILHRSISVNQKDVKQTIIEMRQNLEIRSTYNFLPASQKVYDWIIRPIESQLTKHQVKNLVFVLDNPLGNIPMEALHDGKQYLIQKYNISLTPSLELFNPHPSVKSQLRVLAARLSKGSDFELSQIASIVPTRLLLNQEFTKENVEEQIKRGPFPVIHIASYGQFSSKAEETFFSTYDGNVTVNELYSLLRSRDLKKSSEIELFVLSGFNAAAGDKRAALGLAGVLVRSGASSVIASLWSPDNHATALLMSRFYREWITTGVTKTEALRRAQESLLRDPQYQHPFYWASFLLLGSWL
ncbi:MAG: CHAT domain-containing protein, partial [Rhizonema sp. PD38]|nr:CHAT domain-containing protein [Rhizonema sp. PD38]